jgi:hypothetical protein
MKRFSYYKNSIDSILENSFKESKTFKNNLSVIMGAMKYSKILREFFTLYNEIETKKFENTDKSSQYINEALSFLKENKTKLKKVTPILDKIIEDRKELCKKSTNIIYEKIDDIIFNTKITNLNSIAESKTYLIESALNSNKKVLKKIISPKILSHVLTKNYEETYGTSLTESQKHILKNTLLMTEDTLTKEYNTTKEVTLNKINSLLAESTDESLSAKLVQVKNEITTLTQSKKSYIKVRGLLEDLK